MRVLIPLLMMCSAFSLVAAEKPGRYVLVSGTIEIQETAITVRSFPVIIKLDTTTGETWILQAANIPSGAAVMGWAKLADDFQRSLASVPGPAETIKWLKEIPK